RSERQSRAAMEIEREEGEDRVLAADDEAAPEREQAHVAVADEAPAGNRRDDPELAVAVDPCERERDDQGRTDRGGHDEAPAPARGVRHPREERRGGEPADRDPRLADSQGEAVAV